MAPPKLRISPIGPRESSTQPSSTMEELPKNLNLIPISPDYNMDAETIRREIMQDLGLEDPEEVNSPKAIIISDDEGMEEKEKIPVGGRYSLVRNIYSYLSDTIAVVT